MCAWSQSGHKSLDDLKSGASVGGQTQQIRGMVRIEITMLMGLPFPSVDARGDGQSA